MEDEQLLLNPVLGPEMKKLLRQVIMNFPLHSILKLKEIETSKLCVRAVLQFCFLSATAHWSSSNLFVILNVNFQIIFYLEQCHL